MATITLRPGERFAHTHDVISTTRLLTGQVELTVDGVTIPLTRARVPIPAGVAHVMHNIGGEDATVGCGYGGEGDEGDDDGDGDDG